MPAELQDWIHPLRDHTLMGWPCTKGSLSHTHPTHSLSLYPVVGQLSSGLHYSLSG